MESHKDKDADTDLSEPILARLISTVRPLTSLSRVGLTQPAHWTGGGCPAEGFRLGASLTLTV